VLLKLDRRGRLVVERLPELSELKACGEEASSQAEDRNPEVARRLTAQTAA